jgi:formylmethanofuran dehydrogenase subunit E
MDRVEALRSIQYGLLEYIQKKVSVDFDNARQRPVSFTFGRNTRVVGEVLGRFRTRKADPVNAFLVCSCEDEAYFIYFHSCDPDQHGAFHEGYWVLCFRILSDHELMALYREDRKMLLNITLKRVVDFHGHLCPDLVLGGKLCEYVQKLLSSNGELDGGFSIIAENCTSALDAIQILLGVTVGNQRLQVMDFGKHCYTVLSRNAENCFKLSLRQQHYGDEDKYNGLEQKMNNQATLEEVVQFQKLLDCRSKRLLGLPPDELFEVDCIEQDQRSVETASVYLTCCKCGQQVLKSRKIDYRGEPYCIPCFQRINLGHKDRNLH